MDALTQCEGVMRVAKSVERFLEDVKRRLSPKTHEMYSCHLERFTSDLGDRRAEKLKDKQVRRWLDRRVYRSESAPDTQRVVINAYQQWQKWAVEEGHLRVPLLPRVRKPPGRTRERIPTRSEQAAILRAGSPAFRHIYRCLMYTGARLGELTGARIEDFDRETRLIVLRKHKTAAKVGRDRKIGVGDKVDRILARCIGERTEGPIFLTDRSKAWSTQGLSQRFRRTKLKAGVSADLVLYSARHWAGTTICRRFGIYAAAHALGHRGIGTTQRYIHPDDADLLKYQNEAFRH